MPGETYVTPEWTWKALYSVEPWARLAFECCPAHADFDFREKTHISERDVASNPPYGRQKGQAKSISEQITRHALELTRAARGRVAMLLPMAWDAAKGRRDLFEHYPFKAKYVVLRRIRWTNLEQKKSGPSGNHAWFVWDWTHEGAPFLGYLPLHAEYHADRNMEANHAT